MLCFCHTESFSVLLWRSENKTKEKEKRSRGSGKSMRMLLDELKEIIVWFVSSRYAITVTKMIKDNVQWIDRITCAKVYISFLCAIHTRTISSIQDYCISGKQYLLHYDYSPIFTHILVFLFIYLLLLYNSLDLLILKRWFQLFVIYTAPFFIIGLCCLP